MRSTAHGMLLAGLVGVAAACLPAPARGDEISSPLAPPDAHGAVGPDHVVTALTPEIVVHDRAGGVVNAVFHGHFWTNGTDIVFDDTVGFPYDPRVLYDAWTNRWIVTAAANALSSNAAILVAVSRTANPTGQWDRYRIDVDESNELWVGRSSLGLNRHWLALHVNLISTSNSLPVRGDLFLFDRRGLYTNGVPSFTRLKLGLEEQNLVPAVTLDEAEETLYLVHVPIAGLYPLLSTVTGAVGAEVLTLNAATSQVPDAWHTFPPGLAELGPQAGTTNRLDLLDGRIQDCLYRDGSLWFCQTVFLPFGAPSRSAVQWWQVTPDGAVLQRGRIDDPTTNAFYAYPSLAVNGAGDALVGCSVFSPSAYAGAAYAFRAATDPPDTIRPPYVYKPGEARYVRPDIVGRNAWGEYSATVVDPVDDTTLWTLQEYAHSPSNRWSTWWAAVAPPASADLAAGLAADRQTVPIGGEVTFTVTVTNRGPAATAVTVSDRLPPELAFVSAGGGVCGEADGLVTCELGLLNSGAVGAATVTAVAVWHGEVLNQASASTGFETDTNQADNSVSIGVCIPPAVVPDVWINEIHYADSTLLDANEGMEIAGQAGTDLSGLALILYDGATGAQYRRLALSGAIDHETNGFGAVWVSLEGLLPANAVQNGKVGALGDGDGVALAPLCQDVIQFLSYEGEITVTNGQAAGLTSDDIGVSESDLSTPTNHSVQLSGSGVAYTDFSWQAAAPHSRGRLNPGQTFPVDLDGDGIASDWEYEYFGGPTNAAPGGDGDLDGVDNLGEYIADTDPLDRQSYFRIDHVALSNVYPVVSFLSSSNRVYAVQWHADLGTNAWENVRTNIPGSGAEVSVPDSNAPALLRFYRGRVRLP